MDIKAILAAGADFFHSLTDDQRDVLHDHAQLLPTLTDKQREWVDAAIEAGVKLSTVLEGKTHVYPPEPLPAAGTAQTDAAAGPGGTGNVPEAPTILPATDSLPTVP